MAQTMEEMVETARAQTKTASPQDAHDAAAAGHVILDVREPGELQQDGCVSGSLHLPRGVLESKADPDSGAAEAALTSRRDDAGIYVLCASGARAALAAHTLCQMGYDAAIIEGGLQAWKDDGLPVEGAS
ncbi:MULTISPECIES: rhodanese-like domain-containing protein [Leisingera]|jgi:rhodanese-related sulfurtransferase|uniref:rhodanese-like domain-containing protein n=1 Tax=Leisingera TaxID=191028 RepID=UPI001153D3FB|nr:MULTISPECIES: rhodanese-like domain-containing protein [Leisingera]QDI76197.1 sulfurtransferase [Leisingera aquaemixtae]